MPANIEIKKGVVVINGEVFVSAKLLALIIEENKDYEYEVVKLDAKECELRLFCRREGSSSMKEIGTEKVTIQDAIKGGYANSISWQKHPDKMLFAKAISNATRRYFPELLEGFTLDMLYKDELLPTDDESSLTAFF